MDNNKMLQHSAKHFESYYSFVAHKVKNLKMGASRTSSTEKHNINKRSRVNILLVRPRTNAPFVSHMLIARSEHLLCKQPAANIALIGGTWDIMSSNTQLFADPCVSIKCWKRNTNSWMICFLKCQNSWYMIDAVILSAHILLITSLQILIERLFHHHSLDSAISNSRFKCGFSSMMQKVWLL